MLLTALLLPTLRYRDVAVTLGLTINETGGKHLIMSNSKSVLCRFKIVDIVAHLVVKLRTEFLFVCLKELG